MPKTPARRRAAVVALGLAAAVVLVACNLINPKNTGNLQQLLTESEAAWSSSGIHNYEYDFQHSCDNCVGDSVSGVHIIVKNDVITSVTLLGGGTPSVPMSTYPTVLQLFSITQSALTANTTLIQATFNAAQGWPVSVQIVPKSNQFAIGQFYVLAGLVKDSL